MRCCGGLGLRGAAPPAPEYVGATAAITYTPSALYVGWREDGSARRTGYRKSQPSSWGIWLRDTSAPALHLNWPERPPTGKLALRAPRGGRARGQSELVHRIESHQRHWSLNARPQPSHTTRRIVSNEPPGPRRGTVPSKRRQRTVLRRCCPGGADAPRRGRYTGRRQRAQDRGRLGSCGRCSISDLPRAPPPVLSDGAALSMRDATSQARHIDPMGVAGGRCALQSASFFSMAISDNESSREAIVRELHKTAANGGGSRRSTFWRHGRRLSGKPGVQRRIFPGQE